MKLPAFVLALLLAGSITAAAHHQDSNDKSVSQDVKDAGKNSKDAVVKGAKKTKKGVKKGATEATDGVKKGTHKAASETEKGANKVKDKTTDTSTQP